MLDSFELEIQRHLSSGKSVQEVAETLKTQWDKSGLSFYDQTVVGLFLARSGNIDLLFDIISSAVQKEIRIPWSALAEALSFAPTALNREMVNHILMGCGIDGRLNEVAMSPQLDQVDPRFKKIRDEVMAEKLKEIEKEKNLKLERLKEYHEGHLFEAEEKILRELKKQFPEDPLVKKSVGEYEEIMARHALEKSRMRDLKNRKVLQHLQKTRRQREEILDPLTVQNLIVAAKTHPESAYELTIALLQMEQYDEALQTLAFAPSDEKSDWLRIEILTETHRYIETLEECDRMDQKYQGASETAFSTAYGRARALWGLGRNQEAIHQLETIVQYRPNFRSAHSLLVQWKDQTP